MEKDREVHLCNTCEHQSPPCPAIGDDIDDMGFDNICECMHYKRSLARVEAEDNNDDYVVTA